MAVHRCFERRMPQEFLNNLRIHAQRLQAHQFASSHPSQSVADDHRPFPKLQLIEQPMEFYDFEYNRIILALARLPDCSDWVSICEFIPDCVTEDCSVCGRTRESQDIQEKRYLAHWACLVQVGKSP